MTSSDLMFPEGPPQEEDEEEFEEERQIAMIGDLNHVSGQPVVSLRTELASTQVFSVSCGELHSAAVVKNVYESDGFVYTWGCGGGGRLGNHGSYNPDYADKFEAHIVHAREYDEETGEVQLVPFLAKEVSCGGQHTCALNSSGELFSWGNNRYGQLGRSVSEESEVMRDCFPMLVEMPKGVSVTMIACGDLHCVCIADIVSQDRSGLFSWGCGDNGRLGYPAGAHQPTPRLIEFDLHEDFVGVSCGSSHSAAITSKGHLYTWGSNESGQCGPFKLPALQDLKESQVSPLPPDIWKPNLVKLEDEASPAERKEAKPANTNKKEKRPGLDKSIELTQQTQEVIAGEKSVRSAGTSRHKCDSHVAENKQSLALQVACGENHTLVLVHSKLWILGSGLDRRRRLDNMEIEKISKKEEIVS